VFKYLSVDIIRSIKVFFCTFSLLMLRLFVNLLDLFHSLVVGSLATEFGGTLGICGPGGVAAAAAP
jgi:hypothetical protein